MASALDVRIAALMSRAASETESFPNLKRELEGVKERLLETRAQADELKAEDIELRSLLDDRERLQRELSTLDSKIEAMAACKGELSRIDSARHRLREEMASAQSELRTCEADARAEPRPFMLPLRTFRRRTRLACALRSNCCPSRRTLRRALVGGARGV